MWRRPGSSGHRYFHLRVPAVFARAAGILIKTLIDPCGQCRHAAVVICAERRRCLGMYAYSESPALMPIDPVIPLLEEIRSTEEELQRQRARNLVAYSPRRDELVAVMLGRIASLYEDLY